MSQIANKFLAQVPNMSLKGNNTSGTANVSDLTISQVQVMLSIPTGSSPLAISSGGTGQTSASAAFNALNPMTTTGDMIYESATGVASRLAIGSSNQVLTVVGGIPTWSTATTGANQSLSNLTSPTAINQDLLPSASYARALGSSSLPFNALYAGGLFFVDSSNTLQGDIVVASSGTLSTPSGIQVKTAFQGGNGAGLSIYSTNTALTTGSGQVSVESGNASGSSGASGAVSIVTGSSNAGVSGAINLTTGAAASGQPTGSITIQTSNGSGSGNSGSISLTTGTIASGTRGSISLNGSSINANSTQIHNVTDPSSAQDAATKNYVDNLIVGLSWKNPVLVVATSNITLSGEQTIDGVLTSASRVLVAGQTTSSQNGIYVSSSGAWSRSSDANTGASLVSAAVFVDSGTSNAASAWVQSTPPPITLGTTAIVFVKFSAGTAVTYGNGLQNVANVVSVKNADSSVSVASGGIAVAPATSSGLAVSSGLLVQTDSVTTKINGSNQVEAQNTLQENLTLNSTDITNQYKDLAHAVSGSSASVNSVVLAVAGGPIQLKTVDYVVSLTGGAAGVTRISFSGDLATGGNAALVSGDILMVSYSYLP